MAFSKEYTYWHLTSNGWFAGETRTDFANFFEVPIPKNVVLTIKYEEIMSSPFSKLETTEDVVFEIDDKKIINELRKGFPINFYISPPNK